MKQEKEVKISYWAAHLTTIVSVTLVLILVGIIALICVGASNETRKLREKIELSVVMADSVSDAGATGLAELIARQPYARDIRVVTSAEALASWTAETGENLEDLFGVNPLSPEVSFSLKAEYADKAGIDRICASLRKQPGVEEVASPDASMVDSMNSNIETFAWILGAIALAMVVISFVLINNTVHLTVYSRRFTIHTMQLVGATNGFIRRPFVLTNMLAGFLSGLVAAGMMAVALLAAPKAGINDVASYISWIDYGVIAVSLVVGGALLCAFAAMIATSRYLCKDYDELFK